MFHKHFFVPLQNFHFYFFFSFLLFTYRTLQPIYFSGKKTYPLLGKGWEGGYCHGEPLKQDFITFQQFVVYKIFSTIHVFEDLCCRICEDFGLNLERYTLNFNLKKKVAFPWVPPEIFFLKYSSSSQDSNSVLASGGTHGNATFF